MLVAFSQTVEDVSENARANLEYVDMRFGAPVYVGDTIEVETKVLEVTGSKSNPKLGVVHVQSTARKNLGAKDEAVVLAWQRKVQVWKRDESAELHAGKVEPDASRARCGCRRTSRRSTTSRWRTSPTPTPTSRTSSPARASSTRAVAP